MCLQKIARWTKFMGSIPLVTRPLWLLLTEVVITTVLISSGSAASINPGRPNGLPGFSFFTRLQRDLPASRVAQQASLRSEPEPRPGLLARQVIAARCWTGRQADAHAGSPRRSG